MRVYENKEELKAEIKKSFEKYILKRKHLAIHGLRQAKRDSPYTKAWYPLVVSRLYTFMYNSLPNWEVFIKHALQESNEQVLSHT